MSKNKKITFEDKRQRLLEFFHEKKSVFQLKDVEKLASKEKQIPMQTIKDVLQSLVNDDLVDTDKIGTSTYFWSFPSKAYQKKVQECKKIEQQVLKLQEQEKKLKEDIQETSKTIPDQQNDEQLRNDIKIEINQLEKEKETLLAKLNKLKESDPKNIEQIREELKICQEAVERWTDNIFAIKSWCKKKVSGLEDRELNRMFEIPSDFDYYEYEE